MEEILRKIGSWLFLIGIVVSIIIGIVLAAGWYTEQTWVTTILAILGFVVGIL